MAVTNVHGLYGVKIDSTVLGGITQLSVDAAVAIARDITGGDIYPRHQSVTGAAPSIRFSTLAIAQALGLCGVAGTDIASLTSKLTVYAQKHADGGARLVGSNHRSMLVNKGILVPRRLSVSHQGHASLDYEAVIAYASGSDIIVITDSVGLPAGSTDLERFTLGKVTIGNVLFSHVQSVDIDFGINIEAVGADSDLHPTFTHITTIAPSITIRGINAAWIADAAVPFSTEGVVNAFALAGTHANTAIYLKKRAAGGSYVADATAEHVKITAAGLLHARQIFNASGSATGQVELQFDLGYDGTNAPMVINNASAIT